MSGRVVVHKELKACVLPVPPGSRWRKCCVGSLDVVLPERVGRLKGRLHAHLGTAAPSIVRLEIEDHRGEAVKRVDGIHAVASREFVVLLECINAYLQAFLANGVTVYFGECLMWEVIN